MTEQVPSEEKRPDMTCDCYEDTPSLWGPACSSFWDNDFEYCTTCGHHKDCHEHP
jgi:hypothetical protein